MCLGAELYSISYNMTRITHLFFNPYKTIKNNQNLWTTILKVAKSEKNKFNVLFDG